MKKARIHYFSLPDEMRKGEKLAFLRDHKSIQNLDFQLITPDKNNNWINLTDNDFETLMPVADKELKLGKKKEGAIFEMFSLGVVTNRDEWVYDFDAQNLEKKVRFLIEVYNRDAEKLKGLTKDQARHLLGTEIKWTRAVKGDLEKGKRYSYSGDLVLKSLYRPFSTMFLYYSRELNEMQYLMPAIWGKNGEQRNVCIGHIGKDTDKPFSVLAHNQLAGLNFLSPASGCQCLPLHRYGPSGERVDNITDWALAQFQARYASQITESPNPLQEESFGQITKEDIFHYCYAVLHDPAYRKKYELNLRREFPRLPLRDDFWQWAAWGKSLLDSHLGYETVEPYPLARREKQAETPPEKLFVEMTGAEPAAPGRKPKIKVKLKADKTTGAIEIDEQTTLTGVPPEAWQYKLGNRSALEWVLDQYKEKKPGDPTIAEKFDTYRFADYKEQVIDMLGRVCRVSVETMRVVREMAD